jgi:hypothetical protein
MLRFDIFILLDQPENLPANGARATNRITQNEKIAHDCARVGSSNFAYLKGRDLRQSSG